LIDLLDRDDDADDWLPGPEPLHPVTAGRTAWDQVLERLFIHDEDDVSRMLARTQPDPQGRLTLHLGEYLWQQVVTAMDDLLIERFQDEEEGLIS